MAEEKEYSVLTYLCNDHSQLEDGEVVLRFKQWRVFKRLLWNWTENNQVLETIIKPFRYKRSKAQNNWLWGVAVCTILAWHKETTGEKLTKETIYVYLNVNVLGNSPEIKEILGQEVIVMTGKRFSQMTTKEFCDAVEIIISTYDKLGCHIPLPKEKTNNLLNDFIEDN